MWLVCVCVGGGGNQDVITIQTSTMTPLSATVSLVSVLAGGGGAVVTNSFHILQRMLVHACVSINENEHIR